MLFDRSERFERLDLACFKVLVVQALRPDRLQSAMTLFASRALGVREISPPTTSLKRLYESGCTLPSEPILIVLSPGIVLVYLLAKLYYEKES